MFSFGLGSLAQLFQFFLSLGKNFLSLSWFFLYKKKVSFRGKIFEIH